MREEIYSALFSLVANNSSVTALFNTKSRLTKHFDDVPDEQCPALFLLQTGEDWIRPGKGIPPKRTLDCKFLIYTMSNAIQSTAINTVLDVIDNALRGNNPGNVFNLGGLVEHVYVDGHITIDEGLLQTKSISVIPIKILIP